MNRFERKEKTAGILRGGFCAFLILMILGGTVQFPAFAEIRSLNYDKEGAVTHGVVVSPSELVLTYTDCTLTEAERNYLDGLQSLYLCCDTAIPDSVLSLAREGTDVMVTAQKYAYTAANGATVIFYPTEATAGEQTAVMTENSFAYTCLLAVGDTSADVTVTVQYEASLTLSAEYLQNAANSAYLAGADALKQTTEYESLLATYRDAVTAYETYCDKMKAYQTALTAYNAYLQKKDAYDAAVAKWEQYEKDLKAYNDYLDARAAYENDFKAYEQAMKTYTADKAAYDKWVSDNASFQAEKKACEDVLTVLNSVFTTSSGGHQMYSTLNGPTVKQALVSNREQLISTCGVKGEDIDNAGAATNKLIELLNQYQALKTTEEQFNWYKLNYKAVSENFTKLYNSLSSMLSKRSFQLGLVAKKKDLRFAQFTAHLYLLSTCFDDTVTCASSTWSVSVGKKYTFGNTALELADYGISDTNTADPSDLSWPEQGEEKSEPVCPVKPAEPAKVNMPLPPDEPGEAPAVVSEPQKPATVAAPGEEPQAPAFTEEIQVLCDAVRAGTLTEHTAAWKSGTYKVTTRLTGLVTAGGDDVLPVATFVDYAGIVIAKKTVPADAGTDFASDLTTERPTDRDKKYVFTGWVNAQGESVDWSRVREDVTLYPAFEVIPAVYTVTWIVRGEETQEIYGYGDIPTFAGSTDRPMTETTVYTFSGWDKTVSAVTEDAVYTAQYTETPRLYTVTWRVEGSPDVTEQYAYGDTPVCPFDPGEKMPDTETLIFTFEGWNVTPAPVTEDAVYLARFRTESVIPEPPERPVVTFLDADGRPFTRLSLPENPDDSFAAGFCPARAADPQYTYEFAGWLDPEGKPADWTAVTENLTVHPAYTANLRSYTVKWVLPEKTLTETYAYGETPVCSASTKRNMTEKTVYTFAGWDKSVLPVSGDITYTAVYKEENRLYTVIWKMDGEVRATEQYAWGTMPVCPFDPLSGYTDTDTVFYSFEGWDRTLSAVTGDVTYTGICQSHQRVPTLDEEGKEAEGAAVTEEGSGLLVTLPESACTVDLSDLLETSSGGTTLLFSDGVRLYFSHAVAEKMRSEGYTTVELRRESAEMTVFACEVKLETADGTVGELSGWQLWIPQSNLSCDNLSGFSDGKETDLSTTEDYVILVSGEETREVTLKKQCTVTVVNAEGGGITLDRNQGVPGEHIPWYILPDTGYGLETLTIAYRKDGQEVSVTIPAEEGLTLPDCDGDITLYATFSRLTYTLIFRLEDRVYAEYSCHYGDPAVIPETPASYTEGNFVYTFSGWSPAVAETVTGDATYWGNFKQSVLAEEEEQSSRLFLPVLLGISGILLLRIFILGGCFLYKSVKKKRLR